MENGKDNRKDNRKRVEEFLENSSDGLIASVGELLWDLDKERVGKSWASFAKSNLASEGKDAHKVIMDKYPEALPSLAVMKEEDASDAEAVLGFLFNGDFFYKGIGAAVVEKMLAPMANEIWNLQRTITTLNTALANKEN